ATYIYTLSLHDALPICDHVSPVDAIAAACARCRYPVRQFVIVRLQQVVRVSSADDGRQRGATCALLQLRQQILRADGDGGAAVRSEEHTSELQSRENLV